MSDPDRSADFERIALPHLRAAYLLARWLTRDEHDAEDVMQEAYLRAFKYFDSFQGSDARTWLFSIVRNAFYTWREKQPPRNTPTPAAMRERSAGELLPEIESDREPRPDAELLRACDRRLVDEAIQALPLEFREVIVLRELEECSYKQIATIAELPIGTVMSRLARGREHLRRLLWQHIDEEAK